MTIEEEGTPKTPEQPENGGDDLTTGAENVPAPRKNLPSTGEVAGGLAGLLGLSGLITGLGLWWKRRK